MSTTPRKSHKRPKERRVVQWKVDKLAAHPRQEIFDDLPEPEFQILVESVRHGGIEVPLEILPDGTIICGHQRSRAAKVVGLTEVPVIVRDDLAAKGDGAVVERM